MSLEKKIFHAVGTAIQDFDLISKNDRILVGISGGKDSWVLLHVLSQLKKRAPVHFDFIAVNIDQGFVGFRQDRIEEWLEKRNIAYHMHSFNTAQILEEKMQANQTPCSLCSRLRRGSLTGLAEKLKCNKMALGHHLDDFVETLLLNQFFAGKLASMSVNWKPKEREVRLIRPLVYVHESWIQAYVEEIDVPIVACGCPLECGDSKNFSSQRRKMKNLLKYLESEIPNVKSSLLNSLKNPQASHLLLKPDTINESILGK